MRLDILEWNECMDSLAWRNKHLETLRTSHMLSEEMQQKFYEDVISNPDSKHRYWALKEKRKELEEKGDETWYGMVIKSGKDDIFVGVGGLTNISWENRNAEISLIISDTCQNMGLGSKAVDLLIHQGFSFMNLENIYGECYECNPKGISFWLKMIEKYEADVVWKPYVKYYNGTYWRSMYFNFNRLGLL